MTSMSILRKKLQALFVLVSFVVATSASAAALRDDRYNFDIGFDLAEYQGRTFLNLMQEVIKPAIDQVANDRDRRLPNETALEQGVGVALKIAPRNFTYHVNYEVSEERSGRSYGLSPTGKISDPSDKDYLDDLAKLTDPSELTDFYTTLMEIIADCDARGYSQLERATQGVATDFMAIYVAEQDRHLMSNLGTFNWDDALLQVTLLAAFHAGQSTFTKFYEGEFTSKSYVQYDKVYLLDKGNARQKDAEMNDYWQFTKVAPQTRSGINITRRDFERMGEWITMYEGSSPNKRLIFNVIKGVKGQGKNVFKDIAKFFIRKGAPPSMTAESAQIAADIATFLGQVREDADKITAYVQKNSRR